MLIIIHLAVEPSSRRNLLNLYYNVQLCKQSIPIKRKAKGRAEVGVKVPHDVRQRYVNLFVEEFLKTSATVQDAFEKVRNTKGNGYVSPFVVRYGL